MRAIVTKILVLEKKETVMVQGVLLDDGNVFVAWFDLDKWQSMKDRISSCQLATYIDEDMWNSVEFDIRGKVVNIL